MRLGGGEVGGRTIVRIWGYDVGYQNVTLWVPNIGTTSSLREGFGGKSPLSFLRSFPTTIVVCRQTMHSAVVDVLFAK